MAVQIIEKDEPYLLNHCTKYLARDNQDARHNFDQFAPGDPRGRILEAWRFPIIDGFSDGTNAVDGYGLNEVTFIYAVPPDAAASREIAVAGTFDAVYNPLPLQRIGDSRFYGLTAVVPKGEVHRYRFLVEGEATIDPINPQTTVDDNGRVWSRFFTQQCVQPVSFERWELRLLDRLTDHILPFRTRAGQIFLNQFYDSLDRQSRTAQLPHAYRLDQSVGVVNFIDKLVAREERQYLDDYKTCLEQIDLVLRKRFPFDEPWLGPRELFTDLYDQMAAGNDGQVPDWNYGRYGRPKFFLQLLRRHAVTGAFAHPKYGGNHAAAGWRFFEQRYQKGGESLFDWRRSQERPLGDSTEYRG